MGTVDVSTTMLRFADAGVDALAAARQEIDDLNVFPVPDGDTGTNMYLTLSAARDALQEACGTEEQPLQAFARGALLGARGNSGVILSEMIGAIARRMVKARDTDTNASLFAEALADATAASYAAVGQPVEGTMLTVCRAAAEAAGATAAGGARRLRDALASATAAAREALALTPSQLTALADAGVVDAGGRGLTVLLEALEFVVAGKRPPAPVRRPAAAADPEPGHGQRHQQTDDSGPAYEVMYLLHAPDDTIPHLRTTLAALGDSLVVVGGNGMWNVHVHTDDVGAAIESGVEVGRPHRIRVTRFGDQVATGRGEVAPAGRGLVAVAAGDGLADLFARSGAVVVTGRPGQRPSTGQLLEAILATKAAEVVVLPNDPDTTRSAQVAARTAEADHGLRVAVLPTLTQVQGLAAAAVHDRSKTFDADTLEMTATASHVRHGAVTIAAKDAMTTAGRCRPGDVLGVIDGDFARVGSDLDAVALEMVERLLASGGELVTLVAGANPEDLALAERTAARISADNLTVDVVVLDGGQRRYPLLLSVE
ncbi:MAG: DAK2 domain-containing protein [Nocardioides sp.]